MLPVFFRSEAEFRRWLEKHHATATELWVGFYKKASGKKGITYREALDQALCFGWIDGIKKRVDEDGFTHRFSPRKAKSAWSAINLCRAEELKQLGVMRPAGLAAFEQRDPAKSIEHRPTAFAPALERRFKANKKAWTFFEAQPPGYRRLVILFVMSAKREETREQRLALVIQSSEQGKRRGP